MVKLRGFLAAAAAAVPLAGLVLATLPVPAAAQQVDGWRKEVADKVQEAQEADKKGDTAGAIRLLKEAKAKGPLQPKEEHAVNEYLIYYATKAGDLRLVAQTVEERLATGRVTGGDRANKLAVLADAYYRLRDMTAARDAAEKLVAARGSADDLIVLGNIQFQQRDYRSAIATLEKAVPAAQRAGKPSRTVANLLEMLNSGYYNTGNEAKRIETLHRLMAAAPSNKVFDQLVGAYDKSSSGDSVVMINLYRLGADKNLLSRDHYGKYAEAALDLSSPGEAVAMLEKGMASGAIKKDDRNNRLLADAKGQVERMKSSLAQQEAEARAMATGEPEAKVATAHFTLRNYSKAVEAAKRGLDKGKLRRPEDVHMLLGIALVESKRASEAKNAFRAAAQANAKIRGVADLWIESAT